MSIDQIKDAIESGGTGDDLAGLAIPDTYRAAHTPVSYTHLGECDRRARLGLGGGAWNGVDLATGAQSAMFVNVSPGASLLGIRRNRFAGGCTEYVC